MSEMITGKATAAVEALMEDSSNAKLITEKTRYLRMTVNYSKCLRRRQIVDWLGEV